MLPLLRPMSRFALLAAALLLVLPAPAEAQQEAPTTLRTPSGSLRGAVEGDVTVYRGIPYAEPPVGARRWRAPVPHPGWSGVREATAFAPGCMQALARSRPPWTEPFMHQGPVSEDCLYLNVWTAAEPGAGRPVLVYLHGGGFNEGSGSVAVYDGAAIARAGLVVVTVNYRLGVFGFLAHPALSEESGGDSGNYGLMDALAALRWVEGHVEAFGGDPDRVTLAGQSAGAMAAYLLTASPHARGLVDRVIVQSGPGALASFGVVTTRDLAAPLAEAEAAGAAFADRHGAATLDALRAVPAETLLAPPGGGPPARFRPVVDGQVIPAPVADVYARGEQVYVPLLTGLNADEASAFPGYGESTPEAFREGARARYGEAADAFLALYPAETAEEAGASAVESLRHLGARALARLAGERARTAETDAYLYYFDRAIPWPDRPEFGAFHSGELPYVFGTLDRFDRPWEPADHRLTDHVTRYWANFAATGDPNGPGLPPWPAYTDQPDALMRLGAEIGPVTLPDAERRAFYDALLAAPDAR